MRVLRSGGTDMAVGNAEEQKRVRKAVEDFSQQVFDAHARRARDLARSYDDLSFLQGVLDEALGAVSEEDVRRGMCPSCPYPEVLRLDAS